jgi:signal transduction histidine kinase
LAVVLPLGAWLTTEIIGKPDQFLHPSLLFWICAIALVDLVPVSLSEGMQMSLSFPIELAIAILYGPAVAALITLLGSFDPRELKGELPPLKAAFIRSQVAVSILAENLLFHSFASIRSPWFTIVPAILAAIAAGYLVNALFVAAHVRLAEGTAIKAVFAMMQVGSAREFFLSYLGLSLFGLVIAHVFSHEGGWLVVVFVAPLIFGRQMYFRSRALSDRLAEQNAVLANQAELLQEHLSREQQSVAELQELNRMKSEFVAVASHELRTPLTTIIGYAKTLRRAEFAQDESMRDEFLETMERQGNRLLRLVENLLSTADVERDRLSLERVSLAELFEEMVDGLGANRSRVRVVIPSGPASLVTDRGKLERTLSNLLDNALKYSPPPSVCELGARAEEKSIVMWVRDEGIGIPPEELDRIFERFYQSDSSHTRSFGGVGLGLALVKGLVQVLGGDISVASTPGKGSVFTVTIPLVHRAAPDGLMETEPSIVGGPRWVTTI